MAFPCYEGVRVVLADDDASMLSAVEELLTGQGIQVVATATDGSGALAIIREHRPDVAILDMRMPLMSGVEVAAALADEGIDVPVVVLSALDDPQLQLAAEQRGVVEYLVKGCPSLAIFRTIAACVRR